MTDQEYGVL